MGRKKKTTRAVEILQNRYIGDDAERQASLREERVNAEVARTIYELREESGLTQKELADLIGTTQSVISRLEDDDYESHSLSMLNKIAKALNHRVNVMLISKDPEASKVRYVFSEVVRGLRRKQGLSIEDFSKTSGISRDEAVAMEHDTSFRPSPLTLHRLSKFYKISERRVYALAGAIKDVSSGMRQQVERFAAQSESLSKLTKEEERTLDEFVKFLRTEE
jgi:transcriptional regulator with XRE-family HTH domain